MYRNQITDDIISKFASGESSFPEITQPMPQGDMPGEKGEIYEENVYKARRIFPELIKELKFINQEKCVVSLSGGSGVGKTSIASILAYYLNCFGLKTYIVSGDNYPKRLPKYNDVERQHRFQEGGLLEMIREGGDVEEYIKELSALQQIGKTTELELIKAFPWGPAYIKGGENALREYLGTEEEIEFSLLNKIIQDFKNGKKEIWLKRMGRNIGEIWFDKKDFSDIQIIFLEWTHGNSEYLKGIDVSIYLDSIPQETLEFRKVRNRDLDTESAFVACVLGVEQEKLSSQAHRAKIKVSKDGKIVKRL